MESGIYLMAHKSGLEDRSASGRRPKLQIHASDESAGVRPCKHDPRGPLPPWGVHRQSRHNGWVSVCDQAGSPKRLRAQQVPLRSTSGQGQGGQTR